MREPFLLRFLFKCKNDIYFITYLHNNLQVNCGYNIELGNCWYYFFLFFAAFFGTAFLDAVFFAAFFTNAFGIWASIIFFTSSREMDESSSAVYLVSSAFFD